MAKTIRFLLEMKDGAKARTLSELKEHWDVEKIRGYFFDGRLKTWLNDRPYADISEKVAALDENDDHLSQKLCEIFGVEYEASENEVEDIETLRAHNERLNRLHQYTTDQVILDDVDHVAFDQDDLWDILLLENTKRIYLANGKFEIPLTKKNKEYVGIGQVVAVIDSEDIVDFERRGIQFRNVMFDEEYKAIITTKRGTFVHIDESNDDYEHNGDLDFGFCLFYGTNGSGRNIGLAKRWFEKAAEAGNEIAKDMLKKYENIERHSPPDVKMYGFDFFCAGEAVLKINDYRQAMRYFEKAAEKANTEKKF